MRPWQRALAALGVALAVAVRPDAAARHAVQQQTAIPEATTVDALLNEADALLLERKGNTAVPIFERALEQATQLGLEPQEARARIGLAEVLYYRAQYAASREHALIAAGLYERLTVPRGIGRTNLLLSAVEEMSGRGPEARRHAERAVAAYEAVGDPRFRAQATLQLIRTSDKAVDEERPLYEAAIRDARAAGDRSIEATALHSLGDHLFSAGRYEEALATLTRAESAFLETTNIAALGTVYNSIGRVYRAHGRFDEALAFQLKALELHQKADLPFQLLQSLNAVATVYQRLNDLRQARSYYERALAIAEKSSSQRVQDLIRANLGSLLIEQGQFALGARALEQVIANGVDVYPSRRYTSLSAAYGHLSRPRDALAAATQAVERCTQSEDFCIYALQRRAAAHAALGDPRAALTDINAALASLEAARSRLVPSDFFKQDFNLAQQDVYGQAIALQVQEKQERQALETAELARSRAFLDLLASRTVQMKDRDQTAIASLQQARAGTPPHIELPDANASASLGLTLRGDAAIATPPATRPSARDLELRSFVVATPSAADDLVATAARLQSTLVMYWVGKDDVFIWVVQADGTIHTRRVPVLQARLLELIRETTPLTDAPGAGSTGSPRAIVTRGATTIPIHTGRSSGWRGLYDVLIQPIRSVLPTKSGALLTIVPQGPLLNVSFAALQSPQGRYLLEDYALHYAPAGAVLQFTAPKKRADARTGGVLVVADPTPPRRTTLDRPLPRLPGARGEATAISRLMPASRLTILQDASATEARAREAAAGKAVLHFATHAIVSDEDPFGSFLALGPSAGGVRTDGLLTSQEVYGLELDADLVVLSACRSAGGRVTGDGISAFARAFIYAGTASLVASVWDVADEPTNRLLPDFYRTWLSGASKGRALRDAQLRLLRDLRAGRVRITTAAGLVSIPEHPVFWAGFVLFGEPD
jgi:CHAT domain-containing protein/tetratricopeptide (TPR) repeat protein